MVPTTLLVPLREAQARDDIARAIELCRDASRHLVVLVHGRAPPSPPSMLDGDGDEALTWARSMAAASRTLHECGERLRERLAVAGVSHEVHLGVDEGWSTERDVGFRARHCDATVLVRHDARDDGLERHVLSGALFHSARPLVLLPAGASAALAFRRIVIGWNADLSAARALEAALPLCAGAETVTLVRIDGEVRGAGADAARSAPDALAWLRRHGVEPTLVERGRDRGDVADALLAASAAAGADLLVAGAYGRPEARERLFGGTTRALLARCTTAMLLAH